MGQLPEWAMSTRTLRDQVVDIGQRRLGEPFVNIASFPSLVKELSVHMFRYNVSESWETHAVRRALIALESGGSVDQNHPGMVEE